MGRSVAASTNYHGLVRLSPSGHVKLEARRNAGGTETTLGSAVTVSGLLFYNARYYDPGMGRFVSADSIVPGNASGGMAGIAYKPLTVDVHEPGFVAKIAQENQFGPWYLLSDKEKQQLGAPWEPANPQALNRYSYVLNNPMKWTDPGGHALEIPKRWQDWQAKAKRVIDTYHHMISDELARMRKEIDAFIDNGGTLTMEWIKQKAMEMNLDPLLVELIEAAASILGNGIVSTGLKAGPWAIYATAQLVLLIYVQQQYQRVDMWPYLFTEKERERMPLPGREFFPYGRAWSQAYCRVHGGCTPV